MARTLSSAGEGTAARARILDAAHSEFASHGFRAATLDAIARGAGMSRAGILHHFASKQALLTALLDERDEALALEQDSEAESAVALVDLMRGRLSRILEGRDLVLLAHSLTAEAADESHPAHEWLVRRSRRLRAAMASAFEASIARGELRADANPRLLAALVLGTVEGLEAQWLADPEQIDIEAGLALFNELLRGRIAVLGDTVTNMQSS